MADQWYEIASMDHFWIWRRFAVLQRLAGDLVQSAGEMAEVGCGHGLLQRQIENAWGREVAGIDLNENALKQNVSRQSRVYCYDIFQTAEELRGRFDIIFLFDVLEHIANEDGFLKALRYHLAPGGKLILNVPAGQWAFSPYDVAAGHARRYTIKTLREAAGRNQSEIQRWSYWGLPLVPALLLRKLWLKGKQDQAEIIKEGFSVRTPAVNRMMRWLSRCEVIPQRIVGTSLMAVLQERKSAEGNGA